MQRDSKCKRICSTLSRKNIIGFKHQCKDNERKKRSCLHRRKSFRNEFDDISSSYSNSKHDNNDMHSIDTPGAPLNTTSYIMKSKLTHDSNDRLARASSRHLMLDRYDENNWRFDFISAANNGIGCTPRGDNVLDCFYREVELLNNARSSSSIYKEVSNVLELNTMSQSASNIVKPMKQECVSQDIKHRDCCDRMIEDCRVTLKARKVQTMHKRAYRCNCNKETAMSASKKKKKIENGRILKLEEESTLLKRRVTSIEQELRMLRKVARLLKYDEPVELLESESSCNYLHVHS